MMKDRDADQREREQDEVDGDAEEINRLHGERVSGRGESGSTRRPGCNDHYAK
jgi:hypothetical protein